MDIQIRPVGHVCAERTAPEDDYWGGSEATIVLEPEFPEDALAGLTDFSHVEILFHFDQVPVEKIVSGARHPRGNKDWPAVGIFAQRGKNRPNRLGSTLCKILRVEGRRLVVAELDAIDGTPVIDIKPVLQEFLPRETIRQPAWSQVLMQDYWK